jgi:hypothetical protein
MPLYLVRWPQLEASLVYADDEDHLTDILDEVESPTVASWTEYNGPLWIDFKVGLGVIRKPNGQTSVALADVAIGNPFLDTDLWPGECETAEAMMHAVFDGAFPHLAPLVGAFEDEFDVEQVRAAAVKDLETHQPSGILPKSLRDLDKPN